MRFQSEDELEQWYSDQKERLDESFGKAILGKHDRVPREKERYSAELKKLTQKYQDEYNRLIDKEMKRKK